jgi:hypothetical protein
MSREELEEALARLGADYDRVVSMLADAIQDLADIRAAEAWSTPDDTTKEEFGEDVWISACFGSRCAVNGDVVDRLPNPPEGYEITSHGGSIPVVEEEVSVEYAVRSVSEAAKLPIDLVQKVAESEGYEELAYVSASGESDVWARTGT